MAPLTNPRPGRNDPCHCGSGRKYKQCCLGKDEAEASAARARVAESTPPPEETTAPPAQPPKHHTQQPWKATTTRGFVPQRRTPRKAGGS